MINKKNNNSFIEAINLNNPLEPSVINNKELIEKEEPESNEVIKKKNSKTLKHLEFINNILRVNNEKLEKTNEKHTMNVHPQIHYRLKLISLASKTNLSELTNAIFTNFLEENKDHIDVLIKKMSL